jgi:anaerobic magnesium-protoporphyrin IX monomethyl ester cyclase
MLDVALLVPFETEEAAWIDPLTRRARTSTTFKAVEARQSLEDFVGRPLRDVADLPPIGRPSAKPAWRSLSAIALATGLESAGLRWSAIDPGPISLSRWREHLRELSAKRPRVVSLTTTFIETPMYAGALCAMIRRELPDALLAVGGYLYATDARRFLELDADVLCVGEGESRIVELARAIRDGGSLENIPGLYLRRERGLHFTGPVEPLDIEKLPLPDWSLADRITPSIDLKDRWLVYLVETQRGCSFKCEFCTFRAVSAPGELSVEAAANAILNAAHQGPGAVWIVDPTATHPKPRWRAILQALIARGGSPNPIKIFARVSDLDDAQCELMARARVQHVMIGQESGSQRMLNAMRKGTKVEQVRPAIAAMSKHGITSEFYFIHGFPEEDAASIAETRAMLVSLNQDCASRPCATTGLVHVFQVQDLAAARDREVLRNAEHRFDYRSLSMSAQRIAEEVMASYIALSRVPHGLVTGFALGNAAQGAIVRARWEDGGKELFRWGKAFDRGVGIFLARELEGTPVDLGELRKVREDLLRYDGHRSFHTSLWDRTIRRARRELASRVIAEWGEEDARGVGLFTRLHLGQSTYAATGDWRQAVGATLRGSYPGVGFRPGEGVELGQELIKLARATNIKKKSAVAPRPARA